ncbi:amino acid racemase [Candidatus Bipolaricaulota bacterium]|nr:amino acid racemase [Candidatus Bipolaricaulota bacterium]
MKKIGILGGMGPEASLEYYRLFITRAKEKEPEGRYPELIIYNLNFEDFCKPVSRGREEQVINLLRDKLVSLEKAGVDFALMASNTPHMYYDKLKKEVSIPLLSIVESTASVASEKGYDRLGLLGTKFTMTGDFYQKTFKKRGMEIVVPEKSKQEYIHEKIMNELVSGRILENTKKRLVEITGQMRKKEGIEATILGCTELPLILSEQETGFPVLDTTEIHVDAAYNMAAA